MPRRHGAGVARRRQTVRRAGGRKSGAPLAVAEGPAGVHICRGGSEAGGEILLVLGCMQALSLSSGGQVLPRERPGPVQA